MISRPLTPPCVPFGTRRWLINSFLNSVYLFDDKIIIDCNYKDGTETITFEKIENSALGSDLISLAAPNSRNSNLVPIGEGFGFLLYLNYPNFNSKLEKR